MGPERMAHTGPGVRGRPRVAQHPGDGRRAPADMRGVVDRRRVAGERRQRTPVHDDHVELASAQVRCQRVN